ncbi:phenylacetate--CoA ligase family protein [Marinobacter sediminum]|uniref:phenylacetate--CoA ligase family protein n=1 Tax=Marinobacter sediminum TaxID=256323 RepID=UPI00193A7976|nr:phenylacetate--CoA ligase family protein [Marinobacter sediminum]
MNSSLAKALFESGARLRNPSLFRQYESFKDTEWWNLPALEQLQLERTRKLLKYAAESSPFFKRRFKASGFDVEKLSSLSDLKVIEPVSKSDLIQFNSEIHTGMERAKCRLAETSGTSGEALAFLRNEEWDSANRALMMRSYDWYGVKPWDPNGYLWGYNTRYLDSKKTQLLDKLQNRFRIFRYSEEEIRSFAKKLNGASFISGYSSMIYEVAKALIELDLEPLPLRMVKGTSEMILDAYQPSAEQAFGGRIISEYGAAESGLIAFECPRGSMHVNVENVVLEVDENGDLLVTNLSSFSFPIIRYRLGDCVSLSHSECGCGRKHMVIKDIAGRRGATVFGHSQTYPALTFYYVFKNLALKKDILLNYKASQSEQGCVDIYIEGESNRRHIEDVKSELYKYFGKDIVFNIKFLRQFSVETKKTQYFETTI